jgi:hypothetical protein
MRCKEESNQDKERNRDDLSMGEKKNPVCKIRTQRMKKSLEKIKIKR